MELSESITYHITKTGNVLRQLTAKRIKDAGISLSPEESVLMNQLWDKDNQTVSELNLWSIKDASTLTRQIDRLVKKELVSRSHGADDRRSVYISLTAEGKKLKKLFLKTRVSELDGDLANMSEQDAQKLLQLLISIRENAQAEIQHS